MFMQPNIDPILLSIGPFAIRWYGLMYLLALAIAYGLAHYQVKYRHHTWKSTEIGDFIFLLFLGAVLGGRIGYVLFYHFHSFLNNPLFLIGWNGHSIEWAGMSFHGGLLGVCTASLWYAKKTKRSFLNVTDFIAPLIPLGLFFGRLGNFINGELWGKPTDLPWGVVFREALPLGVARHPSQLYEAFLEGIVLFIILWFVARKPRATGVLSGLFLLGYGSFRFIVEFFRMPDNHLGYLAFNWFTMGMLLCLPMILFGLYLTISPMMRQSTLNRH